MNKLLLDLFYKIFLLTTCICVLQFIACGSGSYDIEEVEEEHIEDTTKYEIKLNFESQKTDEYIDKDETKIETNEYKSNGDENKQYTIQVGAFYFESNSLPFYNQVKSSMKYQTYYKFQEGLYKIQVGLFNNKGEAFKILDEVISSGYIDSFITEVK